MSRHLPWALLCSAFLLVAHHREAAACSPPMPALTGTLPTSGASHPANAPVVLSGYDLDTSAISVKVDGVEAKLEQGGVSVPGGAQVLRVSPEPKAGQKVALSGKVCSTPEGCDLALEYTATEADTVAPGAIDALSFDVFDHVDFQSSGGDCQSDRSFAIYARISAQSAADTAPSYWRVVVRDTAQKELFSALATRSGQEGVVTLRSASKELAAQLPGGFCVEASSYDLAGNKTETKSTCSPCRFRAETSGEPGFSAPPEPTWTEADVVPGGACDQGGGAGSGGSGGTSAGGSSGGGSGGSGQSGGSAGSGQAGSGSPGVEPAESSESGGCTVGRSPAPGGAVFLALLGLLGVRRRRAGRPS